MNSTSSVSSFNIINHQGLSEHKVKLAIGNKELLRLLIFLESRLPDHCDVYNMVQTVLQTGNRSYRVYFIENEEDLALKTFSSIAVFKEERSSESYGQSQQQQKVWLSSAMSSSPDSLLRIYSSIRFINWTRDAFAMYIYDPANYEALQKFIDQKGERKTVPISSNYIYVMDVRSALNLNIKCPEEVYVKGLEPHHAQLVYDHWPIRASTTVEHIAEEINELQSAGVFLKNEEDRPVSWVTHHPPNGMSRLTTLDGHRRRGFANLSVLSLAKKMAQSSYYPFASVFVGNTPSQLLFESMGFTRTASLRVLLLR